MHFSFYFVYEVFSIGHAWMWELDCEESWVPKNWCFCTVMLEKTLESPLDCKEIQPVHPKGDQSWVFTGRTDAEAETPIVWSPHMKSWLIGTGWKGLGAGGEGDDRGWDGWMASLTRWTWVWVNSGNWWWTGRPGMFRFLGLQRVRHDWVAEVKWTENHLSILTVIGLAKKCIQVKLFGQSNTKESAPGKQWEEWIITIYCYLWGRTESDMTEVT